MLLYLTFMMSIVPQVREINITLIQNRIDTYIFYSHVTHYARTYKSLLSNTPQGLNFQQGRSKYTFLSVFINSCIPTACHILGTANTRLPNILSWHPTTWKQSQWQTKTKMCTNFGLYFSTQTSHLLVQNTAFDSSDFRGEKKKFAAVFFSVATSETHSF